MKPSSKKKRTKDEMEEVKQEEEKLNVDKQKFLLEYKSMKRGPSLTAQEKINAD